MESAPHRQTVEQRRLAERVEIYRRKRGMGLDDVAAEAGCSPATISRLINGKIGMSAHHEVALRNLLAKEDLTTRQDDLVSMIGALRSNEVDAVIQILHIMQKLRT